MTHSDQPQPRPSPEQSAACATEALPIGISSSSSMTPAAYEALSSVVEVFERHIEPVKTSGADDVLIAGETETVQLRIRDTNGCFESEAMGKVVDQIAKELREAGLSVSEMKDEESGNYSLIVAPIASNIQMVKNTQPPAPSKAARSV